MRSTIPAPHENVAVQVLGNLRWPTNQGCRLSALSFLPHHHYIRTGHTYLIPLNTINMTPPKPPVQDPVDIPFENGIILTTTINPITCRHSIQCDLCEVIIDLGISASKLTCHFCREEVKLSKMQNHVEGHIMHNLYGAEDAKIKAYWKWRERAAAQEQDTSNTDELQQIGENPCGFCGCFTSLLEKKARNSIKFIITSNCPYYYEHMQYKNAAVPPITCHAQTFQYIFLFAPSHSQGTHRPSGKIMLCII